MKNRAAMKTLVTDFDIRQWFIKTFNFYKPIPVSLVAQNIGDMFYDTRWR